MCPLFFMWLLCFPACMSAYFALMCVSVHEKCVCLFTQFNAYVFLCAYCHVLLYGESMQMVNQQASPHSSIPASSNKIARLITHEPDAIHKLIAILPQLSPRRQTATLVMLECFSRNGVSDRQPRCFSHALHQTRFSTKELLFCWSEKHTLLLSRTNDLYLSACCGPPLTLT